MIIDELIYSKKYDRYATKEGLVFRKRKRDGSIVQCRINYSNNGYGLIGTALGPKYVHRIMWETFKGEIPAYYEVDHINSVHNDNRLENLQLLTHADNMRKALKGKPCSNEQREKIRKANLGKKRSEETRRKLSLARKAYWEKRKTMEAKEA